MPNTEKHSLLFFNFVVDCTDSRKEKNLSSGKLMLADFSVEVLFSIKIGEFFCRIVFISPAEPLNVGFVSVGAALYETVDADFRFVNPLVFFALRLFTVVPAGFLFFALKLFCWPKVDAANNNIEAMSKVRFILRFLKCL